MSNYFFQRIKNLPTTANNTNSNNSSRLTQVTKTNVKSEPVPVLSDDELLAAALQLDQAEEAKKAKGGHILRFSNS